VDRFLGSIARMDTVPSKNAADRNKDSVTMMQIAHDLSLAFGRGADVARPLRQWRGFSAKHVVIGAESYSFKRVGNSQYLAFHDMIVEDSEVAIDGLAPDRTRDWRRSVAFIPWGHAAHGWAAPARRRNAFTALHFQPGLVSDELERRYAVATPAPLLFLRPPPLQAALGRLESVLLTSHVDTMLAETVCLLAVLEVFGVQADPTGVGLSRRHLRLVDDFVDAHLAATIGVSDLAQLCGLSRFHFTRAFKMATGASPYAHVTATRVDRARELLAQTDLRIEAIAGLVGFPTSAQFRRAFRARVGCSALEYRQSRK
jgi:AraC family transcriptional regulator